MSRVPGRSRVKHLKSPQKTRAGNTSRLLRRHLQEPDTGRTAGMSRRGKMGLGPALFRRPGFGGAARENVFRSSARAVPRIEESRPKADTPNRGESNRGSQRTQNEAPAEKTGDKDPLRERKCMQRARSAPKRARRRELRNCVSPAVSYFSRSR